MKRYLYRGVNSDMYERNNGRLEPHKPREEFKRGAYFGKTYHGDGSTYGESVPNAVIAHQRDGSVHSSGVSTTPIFEIAKSYATYDGKYPDGYVYKIDTTLLERHGVRAYRVSDHATPPKIPGDEEVILVAADYGALPQGIVVEIIPVK